jgi:hypothetical protein
MYIEEQSYWMDLVNLAASWREVSQLESFIPERRRDFDSTPLWSRQRAFAYFVNNFDTLRDAHRRLETGRPLEYELLNNILSSCSLRLFDWGDPGAIPAIRKSKAGHGARLETLQAVSGHDGLNPGSSFVRSCVERSFFYFAKYVDYRLDDPAYPDASRKFRILACANPRCTRLFVQGNVEREYCGPSCRGA